MTPGVGIAPHTVTFNTESAISCATITAYDWTFDDGTTGTGSAPSHTYNNPGIYNITLRVSDNLGNQHSLTKKLQVGGVDGNVKVHFRRPPSWGNVPKFYFWNPSPTVATSAWPGQVMTDEGNNWYGFTITGANCANVIMNNNASPQSADLLNVCGEQWYDNGWLSQLSPNSVILPLNLLGFSGKMKNGTVNLYWTTANEKDILSFVVERSSNGSDFTAIGTLNAANGSLQNYTFTDDQYPANATQLFYRLRVTEKNLRNYTSATVLLLPGAKEQWRIYPIPVKDEINIVSNKPLNTPVQVRLFTASGRLICDQKMQADSDKINIRRHINWVPGPYYVLITDPDGNTLYRNKIILE